MKRVVLAAVLLFLLVCFNSFCLFSIKKIKTEATEKLDSIYLSLSENDFEKTASECENFTEFWLSKHHVLCLLVRHDLIDQITISVAGFVPLATFGEKGELASEIFECKTLLEEIFDSEIPYLRNVL
ncbi:MAG: DUF4363 family protein [Oscillospiraceae bacterium]|nr:DUF4363 family protein [Oscillospiraceae bacterium]MBR3962516.1 DUF4363 family protein [Oscillospiraceae bacterium]MBR6658056.1 DUF4363 family protein [Oscillospiraceae bacterium]